MKIKEGQVYTVYMHVNKINGKRYVGITSKSTNARWGLGGAGYCYNAHFANSINKYGWDNFHHIIIQTDLFFEQARVMEIEYIRRYQSANQQYGYNLSTGGEFGASGVVRSQETRQKLSESKKGSKNPMYGKTGSENPMYGKKHSEKAKRKMSKAKKGKLVGSNNPMYDKHHSEETRKKISESNKGKVSWNKGKPMLEETRNKISESKKGKMTGSKNPMYGKKHSEETRKKMSENVRKNLNPPVKSVRCVELNRIFNSVKEAAEWCGVKISTLSGCLHGNQHTSGGYHWEFVDIKYKEAI